MQVSGASASSLPINQSPQQSPSPYLYDPLKDHKPPLSSLVQNDQILVNALSSPSLLPLLILIPLFQSPQYLLRRNRKILDPHSHRIINGIRYRCQRRNLSSFSRLFCSIRSFGVNGFYYCCFNL